MAGNFGKNQFGAAEAKRDWRQHRTGGAFRDEIGGHVMNGHIMATVPIVEIERDGFNSTVWFSHPHELKPDILTKGFVGLTVAA